MRARIVVTRKRENVVRTSGRCLEFSERKVARTPQYYDVYCKKVLCAHAVSSRFADECMRDPYLISQQVEKVEVFI